MLPPYAKPAPRRGSALQRQDDANRPGAGTVSFSSAAGEVPVLATFSPPFWESTPSINKARTQFEVGGSGYAAGRERGWLAQHARITAGVGGLAASGRERSAAQPPPGRGLGAGAGGGLLPGPPSSSGKKMAGGNAESGSRRRHGARPSARLGRPTSCPQRPRPEVAEARHWPSPARAASGGGAATQRPRFPPRWCACAPPGGQRWRAPPAEGPLLAPQLPPLFRAAPSCQRGSEPRGQQRAVGTRVCSGAIGVWKMPPDGGLGLQLR